MNRPPQHVLMIRLHELLARALVAGGLRVTALGVADMSCANCGVPVIDGLRFVPWKWRSHSVLDAIRAIRKLTDLIEELHPDVVHVNAVRDLLIAFIAVRMAQIPKGSPIVVAMARNRLAWDAPYRSWLAARLITSLADGFVALSTSHKQQLLHLGVPSGMVTVIPNPYDCDLKSSTWQQGRRHVSPGAPVRVTYVAALRKSKAQDVLIKAARHVQRRHPGTTFELIGPPVSGEESYARYLARLVDQLDLRHRVWLRGELSHAEVAASLLDTDIVAFPSRAEMMPRAVIEAMLLGKPLIASAVDGIIDLVEDGKTGILVKAGDVTSLSQAICYLIDNPIVAAQYSLAAQNRVMQLCRPERVGRLFSSFYASLSKSASSKESLYT